MHPCLPSFVLFGAASRRRPPLQCFSWPPSDWRAGSDTKRSTPWRPTAGPRRRCSVTTPKSLRANSRGRPARSSTTCWTRCSTPSCAACGRGRGSRRPRSRGKWTTPHATSGATARRSARPSSSSAWIPRAPSRWPRIRSVLKRGAGSPASWHSSARARGATVPAFSPRRPANSSTRPLPSGSCSPRMRAEGPIPPSGSSCQWMRSTSSSASGTPTSASSPGRSSPTSRTTRSST